ncbi:MAG TPA: hypothetical protein VL371_15855 [Gemmataceae bacterium]|nr:hypothetical protein [Gemmataceae bacterium]
MTRAEASAVARLERLRAAIGPGPHSTLVDTGDNYIRQIAVTLKDAELLEILRATRYAGLR